MESKSSIFGNFYPGKTIYSDSSGDGFFRKTNHCRRGFLQFYYMDANQVVLLNPLHDKIERAIALI